MEPEEIKRIREKLGLSQSDLAGVFGDSGPKIISDIETGFGKPGNTKILMLRLLDTLSKKDALDLIQKLKEQNWLYQEQV